MWLIQYTEKILCVYGNGDECEEEAVEYIGPYRDKETIAKMIVELIKKRKYNIEVFSYGYSQPHY